jgi:hypothetical protein
MGLRFILHFLLVWLGTVAGPEGPPASTTAPSIHTSGKIVKVLSICINGQMVYRGLAAP